jgi:hypothetical protein
MLYRETSTLNKNCFRKIIKRNEISSLAHHTVKTKMHLRDFGRINALAPYCPLPALSEGHRLYLKKLFVKINLFILFIL